MSRYYLRLFPALALAILAAPLFAQQGGFGRGGAVSAMMLLSNKSVIEELKLSDEQQEKVKTAMMDVFGKFKEDMSAARKGGEKEKVAKLQKEMGDEFSKATDKTLKPEQIKRLGQIENQVGLQLNGPSVFLKESVAKEMKFNDKQKEEIKAAAESLTKERQELLKDLGKDDKDKRKEAMTKIQEKTKEVTEKVTSSLTEDQKKAWKELTGASFEYKPMRFGQ